MSNLYLASAGSTGCISNQIDEPHMEEPQTWPWEEFHKQEVRCPGLTAYGDSHKGYCHEINEDCYLLLPLGERRLLVAVADGLGGHPAGDKASSLACKTIYHCVRRGMLNTQEGVDETPAKTLEAITLEAHHAIAKHSGDDPSLRGMACTLTLVLICQQTAWFCHVGDSRFYLVSGSACQQITQDQSLSNVLAAGGHEPDFETRAKHSHIMDQALGIEDAGRPLQIHQGAHHLAAGNRLIVCSDGLSDKISNDTLGEIVSGQTSIIKRTHDLIYAALQGGSSDDITTVLVDLCTD